MPFCYINRPSLVNICGYKVAKFHENILSLIENIAKSFKGEATFLTHTIDIRLMRKIEKLVVKMQPMYGGYAKHTKKKLKTSQTLNSSQLRRLQLQLELSALCHVPVCHIAVKQHRGRIYRTD